MPQQPKTSKLGANRIFRKLWLAQTVSTAGDAFGFVAMPLLVLEVTHSVVQMGVVTAIAGAGQLVMGMVSGVTVDRVPRRRLMIACDLGRMLLYSLLPVSLWLEWRSLWLIYIVTGITAALGNLSAVASLAAVANIVEVDDIGPANSRLQASQALMYVIGSMSAGAVAAHFGAASALAVDALSFGASAATLATARFRSGPSVAGLGSRSSGVFAEFAAGVRFLIAHPMLRALLLFQVAGGLLASAGMSAAIIDLIVYRLRVDLAQSAGVIGVCLGLAALGAIFGALAAARLRHSLGFGVTAVCGTAVQALGLLLAGLGHGVGAVTGGAMLWSAGLTLRAVAANALRQTLTPDAFLGRVTASSLTLVYGAGAVGAVVVTRVAAAQATTSALAYVGAALIVVAAVGLFTPLAGRQGGKWRPNGSTHKEPRAETGNLVSGTQPVQ